MIGRCTGSTSPPGPFIYVRTVAIIITGTAADSLCSRGIATVLAAGTTSTVGDGFAFQFAVAVFT